MICIFHLALLINVRIKYLLTNPLKWIDLTAYSKMFQLKLHLLIVAGVGPF